MTTYAIYKGDSLICIGTAKECSEQLGITRKSIYWLASPTNHKRAKGNRKIAIKLEDE